MSVAPTTDTGRLTMAYRKLNLQLRQVLYLLKGSSESAATSKRLKTQVRVLFKLMNPRILFSTTALEVTPESWDNKHLNTLTAVSRATKGYRTVLDGFK